MKIGKLNKKQQSDGSINQQQQFSQIGTSQSKKGSGLVPPQKLIYISQKKDEINEQQSSQEFESTQKSKRMSSSIPSHIVNDSNQKQNKKKFELNEHMSQAIAENSNQSQLEQFEYQREDTSESPERRNHERSQMSLYNSMFQKNQNDKSNISNQNSNFDFSRLYESPSKRTQLRTCEIEKLKKSNSPIKNNSPKKKNPIKGTDISEVQSKINRSSITPQKTQNISKSKNSSPISNNNSSRIIPQKQIPLTNEDQQIKRSQTPLNQSSRFQNKKTELTPTQNKNKQQQKTPIRQYKNPQYSQIQSKYMEQNLSNRQSEMSNISQSKIEKNVKNEKKSSLKQNQLSYRNDESDILNKSKTSTQRQEKSKKNSQDSNMIQGRLSANYQFNDQSFDDMNNSQNSENITPKVYKQSSTNSNNKTYQKLSAWPSKTFESQNYNQEDQNNNSSMIKKKSTPQNTVTQNLHFNKIKSKPQVSQQRQTTQSKSPFTRKTDNSDRFNQQIQTPQNKSQKYQITKNEQIQDIQPQTARNNRKSSPSKNIIQNINDMKRYSEYMIANNQSLFKDLDLSQDNNNSSHRQSRNNSILNKSKHDRNSLGKNKIKEIGSFFKERQEQEKSTMNNSNNVSLSRGNKSFIEEDEDSYYQKNQSFSPDQNNQDQQILYNPNKNNLYVQIRKTIHSISPPNSRAQQQGQYFNLPNYSSRTPKAVSTNQNTDVSKFMFRSSPERNMVNHNKTQSELTQSSRNDKLLELKQIQTMINQNNYKNLKKNIQY